MSLHVQSHSRVNVIEQDERAKDKPHRCRSQLLKKLSERVVRGRIEITCCDWLYCVAENLLIGETPKRTQGVHNGCEGEGSQQKHCDVILVHRGLPVGIGHGETLDQEEGDQGQQAEEEENWNHWAEDHGDEAA